MTPRNFEVEVVEGSDIEEGDPVLVIKDQYFQDWIGRVGALDGEESASVFFANPPAGHTPTGQSFKKAQLRKLRLKQRAA